MRYLTPSDNFFRNVDLLTLLVEHLCTPDVYSFALTCKTTSDVSLAKLWRVVDCLPNVFSLLGRLSLIESSEPSMLVSRQSSVYVCYS